VAADFIPSPARTTTTTYSYLEKLAGEQAPRAATLLLGLRWCFGVPAQAPTTLAEYSLPLNPVPLENVLAQRGGVRIRRHEGDRELSLYDHLAQGKPAIVAADAYHFPFRPAFRRIHSSRSVLVEARHGRLLIRDGWIPPSEGTLEREELDAARYSQVPLDPVVETIFAGSPIGGAWLSVEVEPRAVADARGWMRERLAWIHDEMVTERADERGRYGLGALRGWVRSLDEELAGSPAGETMAARRGAGLLLRPELSSRLYLGVFLRNAAQLLGDAALQAAVVDYRRALGHWQAGMDVLIKTLRVQRPEYDAFIRDQLARACDNEARLAEALAAYAGHAGPAASPPGPTGQTLAAHSP
jgi:hypothetical protein